MFKPTFVWWVVFAGILVAAILGTLGIQVNRGFGETVALRAEVIRSYKTRAELQTILSLHQDLETGQRGYLLTRNSLFLEPYATASGRIDAAFAQLGSTERATTANSRAVTELQETSRQKRAFAKRTIELATSGQLVEARAAISEGEGKRLMDRLRQEIGRMDRDEASQLAQRTTRAEEARRELQRRIVALQVLLIGMLVVSLAFLVRVYRGWQRTLGRERDLAARQEAIFESARDGMIIINPSGSIESLNPAAAKMFGYDQQDLVRRDIGILFEVAPDRGEVETFLKRLAARRSVIGGVQEFVGRCSSGDLIPVEVAVSPVTLSGSGRFLSVLRDITERRQIDQMKTEFVSTVSHELRTPLTSVSGSLGLIAGGAAGELPARAQRLVEIARSNCARLIRLINDILDIEKIESGRMTFAIRPLDLGRLLPQAIEAMQAFGAEHRVRFELAPLPANPIVMGDEDRVMQIVTNLLSNAAKFSPQDDVVQISVAPLDRRFRISVTDRGPGIADEFRDRIFGKFAQADSSDTRQKGGTGLGLNIVREIAERLGGAVSFDSVPGHGATFHVDLPAATASIDPHVQPPTLGRISDADAPLVLHVDDDPDMLRIVASALEGRAQVHSSPSVLEARAALQRYTFDAIILDLGMADGDGADLIPVIRKRGGTPIIVFTAQDAEPGSLAGVDTVLVKSRDSLDRLADEVLRLTAASNTKVTE